MSTKTLRKRIALVTVAAVGAGVLSLSSANAVGNNVAAGSQQTGAATGTLYIATLPSLTGSAVLEVDTGTVASGRSVGLVNVSDVAGGLTAGTTQTATLLSTGVLSVFETGTTNQYDAITVTGGTITNTNGGYLSGDQTFASKTYAGTAWAAAVKPNSGATSMTVSLYTGTNQTSLGSGTLAGSIVVTITAASTAGVLSAAKSGVWYSQNSTASQTLTADDTTTYDSTKPTGGTGSFYYSQFAVVRVRDAYGTAIAPSSNGLLTASATNGALVAIAASGSTKGTQSTAFLSTTSPDASVMVVSAPSTTPLSTTVTVAWNGTTIATKTFTFTGNVAKVTLSAPSNGKIGSTTASTGTATIAFADSAGNAVYPAVGSLPYPSTGFAASASTLNAYVTNAYVNNSTEWPTSTAAGFITFRCGATAGTANLAVTYANNDGTVVTSNALPVLCSDSAYTYTAALDKTSYAPGEVASLTVTFKDSKGNLANDMSAIATSVPQVAGGYLTPTTGQNTTQGGTAATTSDGLTNGVIKYKFVVGAPTIDPYGGQLLVSYPTVNAGGGSANQTVSYTIKTGQTSLNDVLKGIVSLIASINKQIAALAKLVTKKK